MRTNFYLRRKLSDKEKAELYTYIDNENWERISLPKDIHIGKRTKGWKFLWDANGFKYFDPNKESIQNFLKSGTIIDDQYNTYTYEQFWKEIEDYINNGWDVEEYCKTHPEEQLNMYFDYVILPQVNQNVYGEFYIDNLRFSPHPDFI